MLVPSNSVSSTSISSTVASLFYCYNDEKNFNMELNPHTLNSLKYLFLSAQGNIFSNLSSVMITETTDDPGDMVVRFVKYDDAVQKMHIDTYEYCVRVQAMSPMDRIQEIHSLLDRATESITKDSKLFKKTRRNSVPIGEYFKNRLTFKLWVKHNFYSMLNVILMVADFNDKEAAMSLLEHIRHARKKWIDILKEIDLFNAMDKKEITGRELYEGNKALAKCYAELGYYDMAEALILGCLADLSWADQYRIGAVFTLKTQLLELLLHADRLYEARQLFDEQLQVILSASGIKSDVIKKWLSVLWEYSQRLEVEFLSAKNSLLAIEQSYQSLNILDAMIELTHNAADLTQIKVASNAKLEKNFVKARIMDLFLHGGADALLQQIKLLQCPSEILTNVCVNEKQRCFELHFCDDFCCKFFADAAPAKLKVNCSVEENKLLVRFDDLLPQQLLGLLSKEHLNVLQRRRGKLVQQFAVAVTAASTMTAINISSSDSVPCAAIAVPAYKRKGVKEQQKKEIKVDCVARSTPSAVSWEWVDSKSRKHEVKYDPNPAKSQASLFGGHWYGYLPKNMRSGNLSTKEWQDANDVLKRGKVVGLYGEGVKVVNKGEMGFKIKFHDKPLRIYGHRVAECTIDSQKRSLYEFEDARHKHP